MRAVVQRVTSAEVTVDGRKVAAIGHGLLVLVGVGRDDGQKDADYLADKIANLRIFDDHAGVMNRSALDVGAAALVVSQFTLFGDCRKGRRPSYGHAAPPEAAKPLYEYFVARMTQAGLAVATGEFQAMMEVRLVNHGPVTILLDSRKRF